MNKFIIMERGGLSKRFLLHIQLNSNRVTFPISCIDESLDKLDSRIHLRTHPVVLWVAADSCSSKMMALREFRDKDEIMKHLVGLCGEMMDNAVCRVIRCGLRLYRESAGY